MRLTKLAQPGALVSLAIQNRQGLAAQYGPAKSTSIRGPRLMDFAGTRSPSLIARAEEAEGIDGRPRFVKRSIDDEEKVKIAAIDPDFV